MNSTSSSRFCRSKFASDLLAGAGFLVLALLLDLRSILPDSQWARELVHLGRCRPEGTWVLDSRRTDGAHASSEAETLRLEPSGRYRLELLGAGAPGLAAEGYWSATGDGFELHASPWRLGRVGAFAVPVARMNSDATALLTFVDGRSWTLRRGRSG